MQEHHLPERGISYRTNVFIPKRKTLVFIHGLSGSSSAWAAYETAFTNEYNILTFDLRGHGTSKKYISYDEYALSLFVEDIRVLLERLHINTCSIISHSFGTLTAMSFTAAYPDKVPLLVYISPVYGSSTLFPVYQYAVTSLVRIYSLFPFHPRQHGRVDYARYRGTGDWNIRRIAADIYRTSLRVYLYCFKHAHDVPDEQWLKVQNKTHIIHGTKDSVIPIHNAQALAKKLNCTMTAVSDANHIVVLNNANTIISLLDEIVKTI
jgi:pimeloyl-ACP methyl ester carboxylesterase